MSYLDILVGRAVTMKADLAAAAAADRDRTLGLTTLRPFIDQLEGQVAPELNRAAADLSAAGIVLTVQPQYADDMQGRRAAIGLFAQPAPGWPQGADHAKGDWVEIQCGHGGITIAVRPLADRGSVADPIPFHGDPAAAAIEHAVTTLLDRMEAAPRMTGTTLRIARGG